MAPFSPPSEIRIARIATVIVFLALVRLTAEPFRQHACSDLPVTFEVLTPFMLGAVICAVALFVITVLSFFQKNKVIPVIAVLAVVLLVFLKVHYRIP